MGPLTYTLNKLISISGLDSLSWPHLLYYLVVISSAFVIEYLCVGWERCSMKRVAQFDNTIKTDLACCFLIVFKLFTLAGFVLSFGVCYYLVGVIQKAVGLDLILNIANPYLQFAIVLLVSDLKDYFRHRFFHVVPAFWRIHEFHHSATALSITTFYRGHFLRTPFNRFFDVIPYVILGAPVQSYFIVKVLSELHGLLVHSTLRSDWGWLGRFVIVSPGAHKVHHSTDPAHYQKNFGIIFIM